jgi:CRISPR-associated protein Csb3
MTTVLEATMAESSIPVDLLNPGQVFACLGFMEAAEALLGGVRAAFDWSAQETRFVLVARGATDPVEHILGFLASAEVVAVAPSGTANLAAWNQGWGSTETLSPGAPFPFPDPASPATLPALLRAGDRALMFDHWGDDTRRDNVKFWAGAGGYPGAALLRDALDLIRSRCVEAATDPFALSAAQSSSFRLDWRRDYIPIDAGFSLNEHGGKIETVGFPLVEILGALGLSCARPQRISWQNKLEYRYAVLGRGGPSSLLFPKSWIRASLGGSQLPFPHRSFRMFLGWPGKKDQARAITNVYEETSL